MTEDHESGLHPFMWVIAGGGIISTIGLAYFASMLGSRLLLGDLNTGQEEIKILKLLGGCAAVLLASMVSIQIAERKGDANV